MLNTEQLPINEFVWKTVTGVKPNIDRSESWTTDDKEAIPIDGWMLGIREPQSFNCTAMLLKILALIILTLMSELFWIFG